MMIMHGVHREDKKEETATWWMATVQISTVEAAVLSERRRSCNSSCLLVSVTHSVGKLRTPTHDHSAIRTSRRRLRLLPPQSSELGSDVASTSIAGWRSLTFKPPQYFWSPGHDVRVCKAMQSAVCRSVESIHWIELKSHVPDFGTFLNAHSLLSTVHTDGEST